MANGGKHAAKHVKTAKHNNIGLIIGAAAIILVVIIIAGVMILRHPNKKTDKTENNQSSMTAVTEAPAAINNQTEEDSGPKPLYDKAETFIISCIGDNTLWAAKQFAESNVGFPKVVGEDYAYPYANTVKYFSDDELTIANAENNFGDARLSSLEQFYFLAPSRFTEIYKKGGVDFVTTANNHMMDFGERGAESTYTALAEAGIPYGIEKQAQIITTKNGIKVGIYTQGINSKPYESQPEIEEAIKQLREDGAQYVICMYHWGRELYYTPNDMQIELAHASIDAGADLVYGSHPHCLQPIEEYNDGIILYSVGNWSFGGNTAPTDCDTAIIQIEIERDVYGNISNRGISAIPCCVSSKIDAAQVRRDNYNDYCPTPYEEGTDAYNRVLSKLSGTYEAKKQGADYSNFYASWG